MSTRRAPRGSAARPAPSYLKGRRFAQESANVQRSPCKAVPRESFSPLRNHVFRKIWFASLLSNLGFLMMAVGGAWSMTLLSTSAHHVALVQAFILLPYVLLALPAGVIADTYDRRLVAIASICGAIVFSVVLAGVALSGALTPELLLVMCLLIGAANALLGPAWQASVSGQVPASELPSAVALNSVSFNVARSLGPAVGGIVVAFAGAGTAFVVSAALYFPILLAFICWRRTPERTGEQPVRIGEATISGVRFVAHSMAMRRALVRVFLCAIGAGGIAPLMPLIARDLFEGGATVFGILLACFGAGAVLGAMLFQRLRRAMAAESQVSGAIAVFALGVMLVSIMTDLAAAAVIIFVAGCAWMQVLTSLNVAIQTAAPRWLYGRAVAAFQATSTGGLAFGAWLWGGVTQTSSLKHALIASGSWLLACAALGWLLPLHETRTQRAKSGAD